MNIRAVKLSESQRLTDLIQSAYQAHQVADIHFAAVDIDMQSMQQHLLYNAAYVLEIDDRFASTISLRFPWGNNPGPFGVPHIGWFATHPDFTQQGLGAKLLVWLENHILKETLKLPAVTLGTAENHPWLVSFYQKQGFNPIAKADLGLGHRTLYLEKIIDQQRYHTWREKRDALMATGFQFAGKHIDIEGV
ncbi:GNAT family N-acetyltransferase [Utexia brackfieldae]|uniref:GNAT family N-acetyltransferase n=1 Tax=Utexia brackfieldae TaxID=3074108 RepID=UPI00370CFF1B